MLTAIYRISISIVDQNQVTFKTSDGVPFYVLRPITKLAPQHIAIQTFQTLTAICCGANSLQNQLKIQCVVVDTNKPLKTRYIMLLIGLKLSWRV